MENDVDVVPLAPATRRRVAEVAPEDRRQRLIVGEIEIADRGDGDVEVDGVEVRPKHALCDAAPQDVTDQGDERAVQLAHLPGFPQMLRAVRSEEHTSELQSL